MTGGARSTATKRALHGLRGKSRLRTLSPRAGLDFASNDYLGLATSERLADAVAAALDSGTPVGATGSRLLRGNAPEHEALEAEAAAFFGAEPHCSSAAAMSPICRFDHAAAEGRPRRPGRACPCERLRRRAGGQGEVAKAAHNDADAVESAIRAWRGEGGAGRVWIVVESLYSMDGDRAPLADLIAIADRHDAFLFIDEAHATGVYGPDGRGLAHAFEARDNVVVLHTCGKALGCSGRAGTAPAVLTEFLVNRCRRSSTPPRRRR